MFTLITLVPLVWLLAVTLTAGLEKILSPEPPIGFLAQARVLEGQQRAPEIALAQRDTADLVARAPRRHVWQSLTGERVYRRKAHEAGPN